ncbi:MAG: hypothetical protein GY727_09795 [Gammaproteobacteria bacterium]|nr:hypothetical protein [Gammaproteobacteria bacterium]MCP4090748.1 hypothetical protein [Gammaproteobacteria bacterium]MCP4277175.1 hypothetical protein [Gammaproteobacteria bacterium]MCP4831691.1 hypothetical protein [Gammaproteobacteria bacterium]MCP4928015.1 hypothetical protein [Gammaproteobacteria bacterium]
MMGGDPALSKQVLSSKQKFWTRVVSDTDEQVQIVCAESAAQIKTCCPQLEIFEPDTQWQALHEGQLFREYDIEKNHSELMQNTRLSN